jgi:hypothetical protein
VTPPVHAQKNRVSSFQLTEEFPLGVKRILVADDFERAVMRPGSSGKLHLIGADAPVRACLAGEFFLVHDLAQHDQCVLEGKRAALPLVWLRSESHRIKM